MQNETVLLEANTGTTDAASSEVQPITSARLDVDAYICLTAGTASAGSPLVSTDLHFRVWPRTPPAPLIAFVAASQETRYVGPRAASVPVNGATSATVKLEPALAPVEPLLPPHPATASASRAATPAAKRQVRATPLARARALEV